MEILIMFLYLLLYIAIGCFISGILIKTSFTGWLFSECIDDLGDGLSIIYVIFWPILLLILIYFGIYKFGRYISGKR